MFFVFNRVILDVFLVSYRIAHGKFGFGFINRMFGFDKWPRFIGSSNKS
jgi:hypothetical protein